MKNQIEKSSNLLLDIKNIESLYEKGFELVKEFEDGNHVPNNELNLIVRELHQYQNIGTDFLSLLIDCKNIECFDNKEIRSNVESTLIAIMNIKDKYRNLNFLIRQDLLKTLINLGQEIQNCLEMKEKNKLVEVA